MDNKEKLSVNPYTKILVPATSYNLNEDPRLLIPFTSFDKIGFANKDGNIVIKPQYTMYYGECYEESDNIRVTVDYLYGFSRKNGTVSSYKRPMYGLINSKGETIFEPLFYSLVPAIGNKELYTVQNKDYLYAVLKIDGTEIVPYGKYTWIDGFDNGLARVKIGNATIESEEKWGMIDENGKEVLPLEYDSIWSFYGKKRITTRVIKGEVTRNVVLSKLLGADDVQEMENHSYDNDYDDYGTHYGEFAGSYAQDVMRYSDDVINDAFDGEPDAYWNID